jgi:hypothetical protein
MNKHKNIDKGNEDIWLAIGDRVYDVTSVYSTITHDNKDSYSDTTQE